MTPWQPQQDKILLAAYAKLPVGTSAQRLYDNLVLVVIVQRARAALSRPRFLSSPGRRRIFWLTCCKAMTCTRARNR